MSFTRHVETAIVLDTNPGFRTDATALLKRAGVEVLRPSQNGKIGYQEIAKSRVRCDLVIVNMELDDINAIQFMSALRKNNRFKSTHVVIGMSNDLVENVEGALGFGLSGFFQKPISLEDLAQYLDQRFKVYEEYEGNHLALYNLSAADYYMFQKQYKDALAYLDENLKLGSSGAVQFEIGKCHAYLGDKTEATRAFQRAVALDSSLVEGVKEFTADFKFGNEVSDKSEVSEQAFEFFGVPSKMISGGFYDQHLLNQAVVCSASFDDNTTLRNMLNDMGLRDVMVHARGKDALHEIKSKRIDLVITAVKLEDMNGLQLIDIIRRDPNYGTNCRILLWLDEEMTGNLRKAYELGLDAYLLRPYSSDSLKEALNTMMVDEAILAATLPEARKLVKAALGHFRIGAFELGQQLADSAVELDTGAGMPILVRALNTHALGDKAEAENFYLRAIEHNERLEEVCKRMQAQINLQLAKSGANTDEKSLGPSSERDTSSNSDLGYSISPSESQKVQDWSDNFAPGGIVPREEESSYSIEPDDIEVDFDSDTSLKRRNEDVDVDDSLSLAAGFSEGSRRGSKVSSKDDFLPDDINSDDDGDQTEVDPDYSSQESAKSTRASKARKNGDIAGYSIESEDFNPDFDIDSNLSLKRADDVDVNDDLAIESRPTSAPKISKSFPAATNKQAPKKQAKAAKVARLVEPEEVFDESLFEVDESRLKRKQEDFDLNNDLQLSPVNIGRGDGLKNILNKKKAATEEITHYQEQVFSAAARRHLGAQKVGQHAIVQLNIGAPDVTTWVPPEVLQKLPMPNMELVNDHRKAGQLEVFGKSFKQVVEQARLFHGRIHCIDSNDQPEQLSAYLAKIGKVMQIEHESGRIDVNDKKISSKLQKLTKKLSKDPANTALAIEVGKLYMDSGSVDLVFDRVHAHWSMNDALKAGRLGDAVRSAIKSGMGENLVKETMKTASAAKLLEHIVRSGGGVRLLEESLSTGGGVHFLERYSESEGGIKVIEKEIKEGKGVRFLEKVINEGKGLRFLQELVEAGGATAVLEASLLSSRAVRILGDTLQDGGGVSWINDEVRPFSAAILELRDPIVELHEHFWQGRERSEELLQSALKNLERKDLEVDREDFDDILAADNFSLETFKKIFQKLKSSGHQQLSDEFYNLNAPRYYDAPDVTSALGNKLLEMGETEKAMSAFQKALKEDQDNYSYLKNMAVAALKESKFRDAEKWCNKMLRSQPRNSEAYNLLGINCKKQKQYKQSIRFYLKGIKVDPESVKLFHNLAIAYAQVGQDERSKKMFRRAKQIQKIQNDLNNQFGELQKAG